MRLDVTIPATRLLAQAALLTDQYKPVVEEALNEAVIELTENDELKKAIKERVKEKLRQKIDEEINAKADWAIKNALRSSEWGFYDVVEEALQKLMKKD